MTTSRFLPVALAAALALATFPLQAAHPAVELVSRAHPSLVSDSAFGQHGDNLAVSADGRFVAFLSRSAWLVEGYVSGTYYGESQVFLFDRQSGATLVASHAAGLPLQGANGESAAPQISADGRWVAYFSSATNLIDGQGGSPYRNVFVYDRVTGTNRLVSHVVGSAVTAAGVSYSNALAISAGGERVAFVSSSTQLVPGQLDVQDSDDVFLYETATDVMRLVSHSDTLPPTAGYLDSRLGGLSADGRRVVFLSQATNLLQGLIDLNSSEDAFLYDSDSALVTLVSRSGGPLFATANAGTSDVVISADGTRVAFACAASDAIAGQVDSNYGDDIFDFDVTSGTRRLLSHAASVALVTGDLACGGGLGANLALSGDGQVAAFLCAASDLTSPPTNSVLKAHVCQAGAGCVIASRDTSGVPVYVEELGGLSLDGSLVAFESRDDVTASGDSFEEDVYVYDVAASTTRLVSARGGTSNGDADGRSLRPRLSGLGVVAFSSWATDLAQGTSDYNGSADIYVSDLQSSSLVTRRSASGYSLSPVAGGIVGGDCLSGDGRRVVFLSSSPGLVPGTRPSSYPRDAFLFDRSTGVSRLLSRDAGDPGRGVGVSAARPTPDGTVVLLDSESDVLVAGQVDNGWSNDVFAVDVASGQVALVSHASGAPLAAGSSASFLRGSSADGRYVLVASYATDLAPAISDANSGLDLYLCDRVADTCTLVTHAAGSTTTTSNAGLSYSDARNGWVSADGAWVAYSSEATDLVAGQVDGNGGADVFVWEQATGLNLLVSHTAGSPVTAAGDASGRPTLSADGAWVVFWSAADDLVAGQASSSALQVFLHERATGLSRLVSHVVGQPLQGGGDWSFNPTLSGNGRLVGYESYATDLVAGQLGGGPQVYLFDRLSGESVLVSRQAGTTATGANHWSETASVSQDGSRVVFGSYATNLVAGQVSGPFGRNAYVHETASGLTRLASPSLASGPIGAGDVRDSLCASADGGTVAFASFADTLVAHDLNGTTDVFVYGRSHVKGDLSDDLKTDLVLANRNAPVHRVWTLDGDLNRLAEVDVSPDQTGPDWQLGGVDDFDGDGQDDLVFRNASGAVEFWLMNGTSRVGAPVPLNGTAPAPAWKLSATADFDHDARPDLLWRNTATRALEIWTMNGATPTGTITPTPAQATDANWEVVAALDADRDGNTDLLWYNQSSGRIVFWFMDAAVQRLTGQFATPMQAGDANWKVLAAGDYGVGPNGRPGTYDLVWRNATSGRFVVWNMDTHGARTAGRFVNPSAPDSPLDWTIAGPR